MKEWSGVGYKVEGSRNAEEEGTVTGPPVTVAETVAEVVEMGSAGMKFSAAGARNPTPPPQPVELSPVV